MPPPPVWVECQCLERDMDNWVRKTAGCIGVGLIATLGLAQDFDIRYVIETGASYPLRYGQAESGDEVTPQLSITKPTCFIRGTNTKLQIIDPQSKVLQWKVVQFELEGIPNAVDPTESYTWYWNQTSGFLTTAQQADLPAFPNHIEYCQVSAEFLMKRLLNPAGEDSAPPASTN